MEESQEILLSSLKSFQIEIPSEISSVAQINPTTLFSICNHSLRRISLYTSQEFPSYPTSLPDSMADRVRICTDLASTLKVLGFIGDISFHKFLYPSEEDLYELVRFLVKRLYQTSEGIEIAKSQDIHAGADKAEHDCQSRSKVCSETPAQQGVSEVLGNNGVASVGKSNKEGGAFSETKNQEAVLGPFPGLSKDLCGNDDIRQLTDAFRDMIRNDCQSEDTEGDVKDIQKFVETSTSFQELPSKNLQEFEILKEAKRKALDGKDLVDFQQHYEEVEAGKRYLKQLECQGDDCGSTLPEGGKPDAEAKFQRLKDIELETESVLSEIKNREEECSKLTAKLEKQAKVASRRSYVERITEITKNSRKQDADVEGILIETRELQLESNSIEERLHRSYAVVDEMVFREAKKDFVSRQAYKSLSNIHNSFSEIREKILETERTRREVGSIEAKLSTIASTSLEMEKLQADLDAIKRENESLERKLHAPF